MRGRERERKKKEKFLKDEKVLKDAWTCYESMKEEQKQEAERLFAAMDADKSGGISIDEFTAFLRFAGYQSEDLDWLFKILDADKNGDLDFKELLTFVYMLGNKKCRKILKSRASNDAARRELRPGDQTRHSKWDKWLKLFETTLQAFECALLLIQEFN